jgi:large subunit ribosomal protein LX
MSEVKVFRVTGKITKPNYRTIFRKEVRALRSDEVVELIYKEIGSKHRAKRFQIVIFKVEEISEEEIESPIIKKLIGGDRKDDE